jgi:hypothetical protein
VKSFQTQTHYEVLEISVAANAADVKSAFERLSNLYSDDQVALYGLVDPSMAASLKQRLKEAFDVLIDEDRRDAYDAKIGLPPRAMPQPKPVAPPPPRIETPGWNSNYTFVSSAPTPVQSAPMSFTYVVAAPSAPRPPSPAPELETPAPQMSLPLPSAPVMMTIEPRASAPIDAPAITAPIAAEPVALVAAPPPSTPASERVTAPVPHLVEAPLPSAPAPRMSPPVEPAVTAPAPRMSPPVEPVTAPAPRMSPPVELVTAPAPRMSPPVDPAVTAPAPRMSPPVEPVTAPAPRMSPPVESVSAPAPRMSPPVEPVAAPAPRVAPPVNAIEAPSLPNVAAPEPEVPAFAPINDESAITITRTKEYRPEPRPPPHEIPEGVEINGDLLRQVRMARGITLAQLSDRMRISVRHLENVEGDRYGQLPVGVYLRGILMNLARELGLDGVRVSRSYLTFVDANRSKG